MKFIFNWLNKKLNSRELLTASSQELDGGNIDSLNFSITPAQGGIIMSVRHYDRKQDRSYTRLYIINDDADFATEIGRLAAMEVLKL